MPTRPVTSGRYVEEPRIPSAARPGQARASTATAAATRARARVMRPRRIMRAGRYHRATGAVRAVQTTPAGVNRACAALRCRRPGQRPEANLDLQREEAGAPLGGRVRPRRIEREVRIARRVRPG